MNRRYFLNIALGLVGGIMVPDVPLLPFKPIAPTTTLGEALEGLRTHSIHMVPGDTIRITYPNGRVSEFLCVEAAPYFQDIKLVLVSTRKP